MCGIVGGIAERNVAPILVEGLRRLEYRGYDSSGMALVDARGALVRHRSVGKVAELERLLEREPLQGRVGVAHTRWATHGEPLARNAHPHVCNGRVAVVHNGIIENHAGLRQRQLELGFRFTSDTDTEVVAHQVVHHLDATGDLLAAVQRTVADLEGAFALAVCSPDDPERLIVARRGSPLVIGCGIGENFVASDVAALLPVTQRFVFLEEGDVADVRRDGVVVFDAAGIAVERPERLSRLSADAAERGEYRHFMAKEIHEQPRAVGETLEGRLSDGRLLVESFGPEAAEVFRQVRRVQVVACGTSYHAGLVSAYWLEDILGIPCRAEVASEFRYRNPVIESGTLFVSVSQSGETADTLAALRDLKRREPEALTLAICNVPESSLVRESRLVLMTQAGPEIGVASTKAFTTQLTALALMLVALGKTQGRLGPEQERAIVEGLGMIPGRIAEVLAKEPAIRELAETFVEKRHALFLGRGTMYPIAMEGALKLKEISYIHAEAYPAGELKHGPLALVDEEMPVVTVAPQDDLLVKLLSNLQEVSARGGEPLVFADARCGVERQADATVLSVASDIGRISAPIIFTVPLQLLAYHVAVLKGTDVDQPRNLAKSVTVE